MTTLGSVSRLIGDVRNGCDSAALALWNRFAPSLHAYARRRLVNSDTAAADDEDAVVTAFQSFLRRCSDGNYPALSSRDELWRLLVTITAHKVLNQVRGQKCRKRGRDFARVPFQPEDLTAATPTPEFCAVMRDQLNHLMSQLTDDGLRAIAQMRLEGYSNREISTKIGRSVPTVERRLRLIRACWKRDTENAGE